MPAEHTESVIVLDRDELDGTGPRPGVPPGAQVHTLLTAGQRQLERFFRGFVERAVAAGASTKPRSPSSIP